MVLLTALIFDFCWNVFTEKSFVVERALVSEAAIVYYVKILQQESCVTTQHGSTEGKAWGQVYWMNIEELARENVEKEQG